MDVNGKNGLQAKGNESGESWEVYGEIHSARRLLTTVSGEETHFYHCFQFA